jgi:bisphosphoglycerate-independent phosphoglycerate mutase (AlkP superfamily)
MTRCRDDAHALHLIGLVSPNGIHSHTRHLYALVEMAARLKVRRLFVQAFTDGRDTSPAGGADCRRSRAGHGEARRRASASVGGTLLRDGPR